MTPDEVAQRALTVSGRSWGALPAARPFPLTNTHPELREDALHAFDAAGCRTPHPTTRHAS
ncbi:hypothetical protein [Deinococcus pimensis]|uniref:hypothetical protein n=1 Tax=Deinococcus pimensis TaxID=309888 RepID=UPI0004B648EC|nr:hypothetical protein [Deinococcus pimensis]